MKFCDASRQLSTSLANIMKGVFKQCISFITLSALSATLLVHTVSADTASDEVNALQDEISARQARLDQLNSKLKDYSTTIKQKEAQANSLTNELGIIENKLASLAIDLESTSLEIGNSESEVRLLDLQINETYQLVKQQKDMLASLLRQLEQNDDVNTLELIFGSRNFSEMFDTLSRLESVHDDLGSLLRQTQQAKEVLQSKKNSKEEQLTRLQNLEEQLVSEEKNLEQQSGAKEVLLSQTESSEAQYQELVRQLRQEQSFVDSQLAALQEKIDQKIYEGDLDGDSSLMSWPVSGFVITTRFHDPTYPFRNLFEHSGLDLAVPQGTPIKSAAPGYVAFTRTGSMYGNYVMIVHGNGMATLYAHMSKISVQTDQFVSRGDVIGLSGGRPGTAGAGFSTGPHLHFEVRANGIPIDPFGYLISQ